MALFGKIYAHFDSLINIFWANCMQKGWFIDPWNIRYNCGCFGRRAAWSHAMSGSFTDGHQSNCSWSSWELPCKYVIFPPHGWKLWSKWHGSGICKGVSVPEHWSLVIYYLIFWTLYLLFLSCNAISSFLFLFFMIHVISFISCLYLLCLLDVEYWQSKLNMLMLLISFLF